jgi:parallel beta-helix repeat protein
LYVGGTGEENYSSIQEAIWNASDGDTVYVYDDSSPYYEQLSIYKKISLIGEDKNTTIIDGQNIFDIVVRILSDEILISGFTIKNCRGPGNEFENSVIEIRYSEHVTIRNNIFKIGDIDYNDWTSAVELYNSTHCTVENNNISDHLPQRRTIGVLLFDSSSYNIVSGNDISCYTVGIGIWDYNTNNKYNNIIDNYVHHNLQGIGIHFDSYNKIMNNIIEYNEAYGINSEYMYHTVISDNIISNNGEGEEFDTGIKIDGTNNDISNNYISYNNPTGVYIWDSNNNIENNHISNNYQIGVYVFFSHGCKISKNNLIDNGNYNAYFENNFIHSFSNKWRNNFWGDNYGIIIHTVKGFIYLGGLIFFRLPWFNIDWLPARKPYEIGTMQGCDIV